MATLFHVSDLHFGQPAVPEQIEAIEGIVAEARFDAVVISGDVSQRARAGEFQRAAVFIRDAARVSRTMVVPGNHDVAWWQAPFGLRPKAHVYTKYRRYISPELEPVLHLPGVTLVGLNTARGITRRTLTWNLRDLSIIGVVKDEQLAHARAEFAGAPAGDCKVIVMHHNPVKGELSQRYGIKESEKVLGAFSAMGVDLVLCGHDHQEAVHMLDRTPKGTIVATAGTVSSRSRGGRPSSVNVIRITPEAIDVETRTWSREARTFAEGPSRCFTR
jgi:3',5'-cyclic AMP phosphodiesterase CpdA